MLHELKTWPLYFEALINGMKNFEIRFNDRDYQIGDTLILKEFNIEMQIYTGRVTRRRVRYIFREEFALQKGYICMGFW
ncbi:MAG TPA: DUF3850 domain-containing protein [Dehalococcoidia bacterium]|nr:DUF3850 domain-containing protein [Dehalococcoidia bacterium]